MKWWWDWAEIGSETIYIDAFVIENISVKSPAVIYVTFFWLCVVFASGNKVHNKDI